LLQEIATTSPALICLFQRFKITDMAVFEDTKKLLGTDVFNFAIAHQDYPINFELADVLKYKKYGLVGSQINIICPKMQGNKFESESDEVKCILSILTDGGDYKWADFNKENISTNQDLRSIEGTKAVNQERLEELYDEMSDLKYDIYNAHHDRPNMSIKYADSDGKVRGYLLAYEGQKDEEFPEFEDFLYVSDLATDKTSRVPGGRLIQGFVELYEKNYLNSGNMMPIRSQSRESSSYAIIQKQLNQIGEKLGVEFELIERGSIVRNGEKYFQTMIVPRKKG
jgi:hypothetical protein